MRHADALPDLLEAAGRGDQIIAVTEFFVGVSKNASRLQHRFALSPAIDTKPCHRSGAQSSPLGPTLGQLVICRRDRAAESYTSHFRQVPIRHPTHHARRQRELETGANDMAKTHDHEIVSIYPFTDSEIDQLMANSNECVLMWATRRSGGGFTPVWHDGKIGSHLRRTGIAPQQLPRHRVGSSAAQVTQPTPRPLAVRLPKGHAELLTTKPPSAGSIRPVEKVEPDERGWRRVFNSSLIPLRVILAVTPRRRSCTTPRSRTYGGHGSEAELGGRLEGDQIR
jgi:hypothetical protein